MLKLAFITALGAGAIGTTAQTIAPQKLEISAGTLVFDLSLSGLSSHVSAAPEFGVTLVARGDNQFTLRF